MSLPERAREAPFHVHAQDDFQVSFYRSVVSSLGNERERGLALARRIPL